MGLDIAERRVRCAFFCGVLSAVAIGAAGCSSEVSRFVENPNSKPYVARAPSYQPPPAPIQPTHVAAVESQPLPQAQPASSSSAPQYAALQYEQSQYAPAAPQYVPPQPVPPQPVPAYAPPAPQYAAPQYVPSQYVPSAPRSSPGFAGPAGTGAKIAHAAAPRTPVSAVPQVSALPPVSATSGSLPAAPAQDRKSTRLNSSHVRISYAVFCLKKKKNKYQTHHINKKLKKK